MLATIHAPSLTFFNGERISIECDITNGLPGFMIVGLADKAVGEARERVRSAIRNSGLAFPAKRVTLNLAPADLPKDGTSYDLGIAVSILIATGQLPLPKANALFVAELALDGSLKPVRNTIAAAQLARSEGLQELYVAPGNAAEAALIEGVAVYAPANLKELFLHLIGESPLVAVPQTAISPKRGAGTDLSDIYGHTQAKRVLEIAAAGGHNILMSGPPGTGKTLLASALPGIMTPPTLDEVIEINRLHSMAGQLTGGLLTGRPYRTPHHTSSQISIIGGGARPRPGEISLSHRGVLFLDELPEFPRSALESLRQPLEDGVVSVARAATSITFPADFMLVATQNPCPCGYAEDEATPCTCTPSQVARYKTRISGPLLDRIDLHVRVERINPTEMMGGFQAEASEKVARRVAQARAWALSSRKNPTFNARLKGKELTEAVPLCPEAAALAHEALVKLQLSGRAYTKILRVARTIADLDRSGQIRAEHFAEAIQYRSSTH